MSRMKDKAIIGNIGHFDNEIDMAGLKKTEGMFRINIKPQNDEFVLPNGRSILILAEGGLLNAYSGQSGQLIRFNPARHSGPKQPPDPAHFGHGRRWVRVRNVRA
jgi:hypothetical protein